MESIIGPVSSASSMQRPTKPTRRAGTTRERLGCLTCRHRRKKCDELYPICGHCRRLNLVCKREEPRQIIPDSLPKQEAPGPLAGTAVARRSPPSNLPRFVDIWSLDPEKSQDRRAMLSYYTEVLAVLLTTSHDNNSFLSVFLPMAMDSKPLQMSLVAWSSAHLSRLSKTHEITALENRSSALIHVASSLRDSITTHTDSDTMLASCLVLCATEIAFGDTDNWYRHLQGAKQIILSARSKVPGGRGVRGAECFTRSRDGQWLLRNFAYHDVLGSVASTEGPLLSGAYWIQDDITIVDSYVGIGSGALALLSEVCELDTRRMFPETGSPISGEVKLEVEEEDEEEEDEVEDDDFWQTADELENRLQQWVCPECSDPILVELALSYRTSALLALYRKERSRCYSFKEERSASSINEKIAEAVEETMVHIQQIPLNSLPECGLLFPLFMAGGDTLEAKNIEVVRLRLQELLDNRRFGNIERAREVLEELWRLRVTGAKGPEGRDLDWMDILKRKGWRLMLS